MTLSIITAVVTFFILLIVGTWYFLSRIKNGGVARAEIQRIEMAPRENLYAHQEMVRVIYRFSFRRKAYNGQCLVPLFVFLPEEEATIAFDPAIELPVLFVLASVQSDSRLNRTREMNRGTESGKSFGYERIVGEEAIEHYLLAKTSVVNVRFLLRDPARNFIVHYTEGNKKVEKKQSGRP